MIQVRGPSYTAAMRQIVQRLIHPRWLRQVGAVAAQEERNRLARDLHDSIKQQLFSIKVSSAAAQERWERDPEGARKALADVQQSAQEAMVEMQALLHQLRPEAVAAIGLVEALREQCEALGYRTGADVTLDLGEQAPDDRLVPGTQEAVFRMAQEALANVARHARAQHVRVELGCSGDAVVLRVQDDGQGVYPPATQRGMGLHNLEERAQALGGRCTVESAPGAGTTVAVSIPLVAPPPVVPKVTRLLYVLLDIAIHPLLFYMLDSLFFSEPRLHISGFTRFMLLYMTLSPPVRGLVATVAKAAGITGRPSQDGA